MHKYRNKQVNTHQNKQTNRKNISAFKFTIKQTGGRLRIHTKYTYGYKYKHRYRYKHFNFLISSFWLFILNFGLSPQSFDLDTSKFHLSPQSLDLIYQYFDFYSKVSTSHGHKKDKNSTKPSFHYYLLTGRNGLLYLWTVVSGMHAFRRVI